MRGAQLAGYRKFDIIESVGVLHHMADPLLGWECLTDCLKKDALINSYILPNIPFSKIELQIIATMVPIYPKEKSFNFSITILTD